MPDLRSQLGNELAQAAQARGWPALGLVAYREVGSNVGLGAGLVGVCKSSVCVWEASSSCMLPFHAQVARVAICVLILAGGSATSPAGFRSRVIA